MKKIFIMAHSLEIGGAERALLGLLEVIDKEKYHVDLFLLRHTGELMQYLPKEIHLLPENESYSQLGIPLRRVVKNGKIKIAFCRLYGKIKAFKRIKELNINCDNNIQNEYSHKYSMKALPIIDSQKYDLAISFMSPHYFVTNKVNAIKKIAWIHTDYETFKVDVESELKMWSAYDFIASISDNVTNSFLKTFPSLRNRIVLIPNIMHIEYINALSVAFDPTEEMSQDGYIKCLSIGRFCTAKNFDNVPEICKMLIDKGLKIIWYIIGYGSDENLIRNKINEFEMQSNVIILGKKENPYPYIKNCDIYIQPSRYEGKCVSVIEAQILHKPVIITNYATSSSQLENGVDGIIVPMDNAGCADGIENMIKNKQMMKQISDATYHTDYSNSFGIQRLYEIIGE